MARKQLLYLIIARRVTYLNMSIHEVTILSSRGIENKIVGTIFHQEESPVVPKQRKLLVEKFNRRFKPRVSMKEQKIKIPSLCSLLVVAASQIIDDVVAHDRNQEHNLFPEHKS